MKGITLKQIANQLKVSPSTVSRALSDNYQIGMETKRKVLAFAKENNYVANRFAQGLRNGKTKTIGIIIPKLNSAFTSQLLNGVTDYCQLHDYQLVFMQSNESYEQECKCISALQASGADGILISPSISTNDFSHLLKCQKEGFPIVILDRISDQLPISSVGLENQNASYEITKVLLKKGYQRLAIVNFKPDILFARERLRGYLRALEEESIDYDSNLSKFLFSSDKDAYQSIEEFIFRLGNEHRADAVIGMTDTVTLKLLETVAKLKLPIKVAGFCNDDFVRLAYPDADMVSQPAYDLGRLAAEKLLSKIETLEHQEIERIRLSCNQQEPLNLVQAAVV